MTNAEKDAMRRVGLFARLSRALNRCHYCGHDRRTQACCGIVYLPDRTEEPAPRVHTGRRCDCEQCWTTVTPPGAGKP